MKILFIANARWKDGMSGSDNIYRMFLDHWGKKITTWDMMDIDFKPFSICYGWRILLSMWEALITKEEYEFVYSCSDFMMDVFPSWILKKRGKAKKWVAGFYMVAPSENRIYFFTQKITKWLIEKFADVVLVTNPTLYYLFPNKKKTWINGGIDTFFTEMDGRRKDYDCVFCGRIHKTKGVDELVDIWEIVRATHVKATLAIVGDGDLGKEYLMRKMKYRYGNLEGITFFGHLGEERYEVFKRSKCVLYPTPKKYDHFSMSPIDAMACGCPMFCFDIPSVTYIKPEATAICSNTDEFAHYIKLFLRKDNNDDVRKRARNWALRFEERKEAERIWNYLEETLGG